MKKITKILLMLLVCVQLCGKEVVIRFLHTNDLHGGLKPSETSEKYNFTKIGGFETIKSYVQQEKIKSLFNQEIFMLVDAGDFYQGTPIGDFSHGEAVVEMMNFLGYQVGTIGNHEFDHKIDNLEKLSRIADFPLLCSNLVIKETGKIPDFLKPYLIFEEKNIKIGITAIMTEQLSDVSLAENVESVEVLNAEKTLKKLLPVMKAEGADIIVVISHMGYEEDKILASQIPQIDLIIGSHSHTMLKEPDLIPNGPMIVQAFNKGFCVGNAYLKYDTVSKKITDRNAHLEFMMHDKIPSSLKIIQEVKKRNSVIEKQMMEKICVLDRSFSIDELCIVFGNVLKNEFSTEIGFMNVGGVRAPLKKGQIVFEDVYNVLPFNNRVMRFKLKGSVIKDIIEATVANPRYGLLMAVGIKIEAEKDKVLSISFNGSPLGLEKSYTCTANDFLLTGGDGFPQFLKSESVEYTGVEMRTFFLDYLKAKGTIEEVKNPYEFR